MDSGSQRFRPLSSRCGYRLCYSTGTFLQRKSCPRRLALQRPKVRQRASDRRNKDIRREAASSRCACQAVMVARSMGTGGGVAGSDGRCIIYNCSIGRQPKVLCSCLTGGVGRVKRVAFTERSAARTECSAAVGTGNRFRRDTICCHKGTARWHPPIPTNPARPLK